MSHFCKLNCKCEVTATKFICDGRYLLTAQGPFLSLYDSTKGFYMDSFQVLASNKIHGIRTYEYNDHLIILCFGGRQISISLFSEQESKIYCLHSPLLLNDWIFDAKLLPNINDSDHKFDLFLGMMHNEVLMYSISLDLTAKSLSHSFIQSILSENTSILYSLSFYGSNRDNLMIAAGDCFNHVTSHPLLPHTNTHLIAFSHTCTVAAMERI